MELPDISNILNWVVKQPLPMIGPGISDMILMNLNFKTDFHYQIIQKRDLLEVLTANGDRLRHMPMVFMLLLFLIQPSLASAVSLLVPVGAVIAILISRILYKRGKL